MPKQSLIGHVNPHRPKDNSQVYVIRNSGHEAQKPDFTFSFK